MFFWKDVKRISAISKPCIHRTNQVVSRNAPAPKLNHVISGYCPLTRFSLPGKVWKKHEVNWKYWINIFSCKNTCTVANTLIMIRKLRDSESTILPIFSY